LKRFDAREAKPKHAAIMLQKLGRYIGVIFGKAMQASK
jgi:hypothetical protein